jgi:hypothetical protein
MTEEYTPGQALPDNKQWENRYEIQSTTNPEKKYILAKNKASGLWGCSCPAYRFRRTCTHVQNLDLPTPERITPRRKR